jgi:hypothetical protein
MLGVVPKLRAAEAAAPLHTFDFSQHSRRARQKNDVRAAPRRWRTDCSFAA